MAKINKVLLLVKVILAIGMMVNLEDGFSVTVNNPMTENLNGGGWDINNVNNLVSKKISGIRYADQFAGADAGAKIAAAIADLPATGGTVDARGLEGAQTISSTITLPANKPVTLVCGATTYTVTASVGIQIEDGFHLFGSGTGSCEFVAGANNVTLLKGTGTSTDQINNVVLKDFLVNGNSSSFTGTRGIDFTYVVRARLYNVDALNAASDNAKFAACFETKWYGGSASMGKGYGIYLTESGTSGNSSFAAYGVKTNNNTLDGVFIEGSAGGVVLSAHQSDSNSGAGLRTAATVNSSPNSLTILGGVMEANTSATAQIILTGSAAQPLLNTRIIGLLINGSGGSATAIDIDRVEDIVLNVQSFAHTNFVNLSANINKVTITEGTRTTDTNFYKTGSSSATVLRDTNGGWQLGANLSSPLFKINSLGEVSGPAGAFSNSISVGGGTAITKHISATASLDFTALAARTCETLTITVTGAADGNVVTLGIPNSLADVDGATERTTFFGWVSAPNTVSVRRCNVTGTVTANPGPATVRVDVWQH